MVTRKMLNDRVTISTIAVTDQPRTRSEPRARILTPKGELAVLTDGITPLLHLTYVELRRGLARGNHYHKIRNEQFYLISGQVELQLKDPSTGEQARAILQPGDLALISPNIAHCFVPLEPGHALEFAPEPFDGSDVFPHSVQPTQP